MAGGEGDPPKKKFGSSFKKLGALFSRPVLEETKSRTFSLPDIYLEEEEGEFWEPTPDPIYQNIDCISLNRYQLSDSDSEAEYDYCEQGKTAAEQSPDQSETIYADPNEPDSDSSLKPAEHQYCEVVTTPEKEDSGESLSVVYHTSSLIPPVDTVKQEKDDNIPVYQSKPEDLILPVFSNSDKTVTFQPATTAPDLQVDCVNKDSGNQSEQTESRSDLSDTVATNGHCQIEEKEKVNLDSESTVKEKTDSCPVEPADTECTKDEESDTKVTETAVKESTTAKESATVKKSFEQFSLKVSVLRQKLELKAHTKKEIFDKYTAHQKPKQRSKPKLSIMAETPDGSKFKNIRMMFENQGSSSPTSAPKPKKISVTGPPSSNGSSTSITERKNSRNGGGGVGGGVMVGVGGGGREVRKHPVLTPTDNRRNPLSSLSNISTDNRLSVPDSNRSSAVSDLSSSEDEAPIVSECETQDPESDVGETEVQEVLYKEEMTKRKEETPAEKNRRKRFKIAEELYTTEEVYYSTLTLINETFRNRLKNDKGEYMFPDKTIREIFMNTHELHNLHEVLRNKLKDRIENWQLRPRIGDIMKSIAPYFQLYTDYMAKFENAIKTLNEMCTKNEKFSQIVKDLEADEQHCQKLKISQHMLGPVQRIPRYRMLLEQYIERLEEISPDYPDVKDSLDKVALAANKANDNITKLENFQLVSQLLSNVSGLGTTLERQETRAPMVYIKHGKIMKMSRRNIQDRFIFLFSDVILICKIEGHGKYKCNRKIFVNELRSIADSSDPNMTYPFELITKKCSFTLGGKDEDEKRSWMAALGRVMAGGGQATATSSPQRLGLVAPVWIPDNGVSMCMSCERTFTTILRRHHCRACGKVFCSMCSSNKQWLAFDNKSGRVCDSCNSILSARDGMDDKTRKTRGLTNSNFFNTKEETCEDIPDSTLSKGTIQSGSIFGYVLVKFSDKDYQKYWCVVRGVILHLYAGTYDKKAKKEMPLLGWSIAEPQESDKVQDVSLTLKVGHQGLDPMFLKFQSESEKERWYEALEKATFVE